MSTEDKKFALQNIQNNWETSGVKSAIEDNIKFLESLIFSITEEDNKLSYTAKDLNIAKREILVKLTNLPSKLLNKLTEEGASFTEADVLKGFIDYNG